MAKNIQVGPRVRIGVIWQAESQLDLDQAEIDFILTMASASIPLERDRDTRHQPIWGAPSARWYELVEIDTFIDLLPTLTTTFSQPRWRVQDYTVELDLRSGELTSLSRIIEFAANKGFFEQTW